MGRSFVTAKQGQWVNWVMDGCLLRYVVDCLYNCSAVKRDVRKGLKFAFASAELHVFIYCI